MTNPAVLLSRASALLLALSCVALSSAAFASSIDTKLIDEKVKEKSDAISVCYEEGLSRRPKLAGKIVVLFVVENDGAVSSVSVAKKGTSMKDEAVTSCIVAEFEKLTFPGRVDDGCDASKENCTVKITYPLTFTP